MQDKFRLTNIARDDENGEVLLRVLSDDPPSIHAKNAANTDANEPFARRIQTSETVDLNQGNGRLNQAKQHQAIQYNWIKPH